MIFYIVRVNVFLYSLPFAVFPLPVMIMRERHFPAVTIISVPYCAPEIIIPSFLNKFSFLIISLNFRVRFACFFKLLASVAFVPQFVTPPAPIISLQ